MRRFSALPLALVVAITLVAPSSFAENKKKDPEEIGNRDVGKGVNFYSLEKEIALGKQLAQEVERQAKIIDDRSEEHTSELQSQSNLVCRLLLEKKKNTKCHVQHIIRACI